MVMATVTENVPENLAGRVAGHDDHGPERDVLEGHCQSLVFAVPGHRLSLGAKVAKEVCRRHCHRQIVSQVEHAAQ
jgi:hypothetical protein